MMVNGQPQDSIMRTEVMLTGKLQFVGEFYNFLKLKTHQPLRRMQGGFKRHPPYNPGLLVMRYRSLCIVFGQIGHSCA